jgi:hypothetical protein
MVALATSTNLSIRQIQARIAGQVSRSMVGEITKWARFTEPPPLCPLFARILNLAHQAKHAAEVKIEHRIVAA